MISPFRLDIIISVHIPKCAGKALAKTLETMCNPSDIYYDYDDSPFNPESSVNTDADYFKRFDPNAYGFLQGKRVVHGHFHPNKYKALAPATRITILREPLDRLISHYYFWKRPVDNGHPLHRAFLDNQMTLEEFAEIPSVRHFYSGVFFKDVDMNGFDIIGSFADMDGFTSAFSRLRGLALTLPVINRNPLYHYSDLKNAVLQDTKRVEHLRALLADDIAFYERWAGKGC